MSPLQLIVALCPVAFMGMHFVAAEGQDVEIWPDLYCHPDYIRSEGTLTFVANRLCNDLQKKGSLCYKFCVLQWSSLLGVAEYENRKTERRDYEFRENKVRPFLDSNFGENCTSDRPGKLQMFNALMACDPLVAPVRAQLEMNSEENCGKWSEVFNCVEQAMKC